MTIYQIISPNGTKVCKIRAVSKVTTETGIYFYAVETPFKLDDWIAELPPSWVAISVDIIENVT